ncbi:putative FAD-binding PCMH-type domain-containing protein [Seiridium cardinale]
MASQRLPTKYLDPLLQSTHADLFASSVTVPLEPVLPPEVSQAQHDAAIREFVNILGSSFVLIGEALREYIDPYELFESEAARKAPSAAICPSNNEELKASLLIANKYKIPLWKFSKGKNLGYGGPAPVVSGSIALDLYRMNKIIEVNDELHYAVVEPGVSFCDLYDYCEANRLKVWPSVPSLGWGSVVGNTLDRGVGFTPTAVHHQHISGLEVMLASGELLRTGQFGISQSKSAHLSKFQFGPTIDGLFLQSNLGVVTKLGIWLTPQPQAYLSCYFDMPRFEDVGTIVDTFSGLRRNGVLPNMVYISNIVEHLAMIGRREEFWSGEGAMPDWRIAELQKKYDMGYWNAKFGLYGPRDVIQAQYNEVQKIVAEKAPEGRLRSEMFAANHKELLDAKKIPEPDGGMFVGIPSLWSLPIVKFRLPKEGGIGGHADYSPIIPSDGREVLTWLKLAKDISGRLGYELFCDFFMHERHVILINMLVFDKTKSDQRQSVDAILKGLVGEGSKRGYSSYRSHINHMGE